MTKSKTNKLKPSPSSLTNDHANELSVKEDVVDTLGKKVKVLYVPSAPVNAYLYLYNLICWIGWMFFFVKLVLNLPIVNEKLFPDSPPIFIKDVFVKSWPILSRLQILALLEILHVMLKFTKGSVSATTIQVLGRNLNLFVFTWYLSFESVQSSPAVALTYLAWCTIELVRYPVYLFSLAPQVAEVFSSTSKARRLAHIIDTIEHVPHYSHQAPFWLLWLRYSLWIPLYPIGAFAESWTMFNVSQEFHAQFLSSQDNFFLGLTYTVYALILALPFFLKGQIAHLWKQRKSKLYPKRNTKNNDKVKTE